MSLVIRRIGDWGYTTRRDMREQRELADRLSKLKTPSSSTTSGHSDYDDHHGSRTKRMQERLKALSSKGAETPSSQDDYNKRLAALSERKVDDSCPSQGTLMERIERLSAGLSGTSSIEHNYNIPEVRAFCVDGLRRLLLCG